MNNDDGSISNCKEEIMKTLNTSLKMKSMRICLKIRARFKRATSVAVVAALLACPALGSTHWAIISNLNGAPHPSASMDISSDAGGSLAFVAIPQGGAPTPPFTASFNENGFASTLLSTFPNFFTLAEGVTGALVRLTVGGAIVSAVLHQKTGKSEVFLSVPPVEKSVGTKFLIPVGDLEKGTFLLIGNPGGTAAALDVRLGLGGMRLAAFPVPPTGFVVYQVTNDHSNILLASDQPVFVQYAVDNGTISETFVLPTG